MIERLLYLVVEVLAGVSKNLKEFLLCGRSFNVFLEDFLQKLSHYVAHLLIDKGRVSGVAESALEHQFLNNDVL